MLSLLKIKKFSSKFTLSFFNHYERSEDENKYLFQGNDNFSKLYTTTYSVVSYLSSQ